MQCLIDQIVGPTVEEKEVGPDVAVTVVQMDTVATLMEEEDVPAKCLMSSRNVLKILIHLFRQLLRHLLRYI